MRAIDPVIATLILIAIAVIAGVFVLRQFLLLSTTSGQQNMLQIQDLTFFRQLSPDGKKMNVTLQFSIKNVGERRIQITNITVPDAGYFNAPANLFLNPGDVYTSSLQVLVNANYTQAWDTGTEHLVEFHYIVQGNPNEQVVSQKGTVQ